MEFYISHFQANFSNWWVINCLQVIVTGPHWSWLMTCPHWYRWMVRSGQATSHYLSQYWPSSLSPYHVTRPQWFNTLKASAVIWCLETYSTLIQIMKLPEPVLTGHQWGHDECPWGQLHRNGPWYFNEIMKRTRQPHLPGAIDLTHNALVTH